MTEASAILIAELAMPGRRALKIARTITLLVTEGAALGELVEVPVTGADGGPALREDGSPRVRRRPPTAWFDRLALALLAGAFDRMSAEKIVERIFTTPSPAPEQSFDGANAASGTRAANGAKTLVNA